MCVCAAAYMLWCACFQLGSIPPVAVDSNVPAVPPVPPPRILPDEVIFSIRQQSTSRPNFAWRLVQAVFGAGELLANRSVHGKHSLDPERMASIRAAVLYGYPTTAGSRSEAQYEWHRCEAAISKGIKTLAAYNLQQQKKKTVSELLATRTPTLKYVDITPMPKEPTEEEPASSLTLPTVKTDQNLPTVKSEQKE